MGYKTILRELLWFIKGSTDNQELNSKNVSHIWDGNASKQQFLGSRGYPMNKVIWDLFMVFNGTFWC